MTAQEYYARKRKKQREQRNAILTVIGIVLLIFGLGVLFGWHLGTAHAVEPIPAQLTEQAKATPQITPKAETPRFELVADTPSITTCNLIVSDEGHFLSYDLQDDLQAACTEYGVPYALALAVADQESRFDPDAKSSTNDHGLMQINKINFKWLREREALIR